MTKRATGGDKRGGCGGGEPLQHPLRFFRRHVMRRGRGQETQVFKSLPPEASDLIEYRFPDYLDLEGVRHSDLCYTIVLIDLDYKHYTFRLHQSVGGAWTLAPISGFWDNEDSSLATGWLRGGST